MELPSCRCPKSALGLLKPATHKTRKERNEFVGTAGHVSILCHFFNTIANEERTGIALARSDTTMTIRDPVMQQFEPFWHGKRLTPSQLLVHDIKLKTGAQGNQTLEVDEDAILAIMPKDTQFWGEQASKAIAEAMGNKVGATGSEQQRVNDLKHEYGWMNGLRVPKSDRDTTMCRWV